MENKSDWKESSVCVNNLIRCKEKGAEYNDRQHFYDFYE